MKKNSTSRKTSESTDDLSKLLKSLQSFQGIGPVDPSSMDQLSNLISNPDLLIELMNHPDQLDELSSQLELMGADEVGSGPPLEINDYYQDGPDKYQLHWPLDPSLPLPVPFDQLDRKTQFFILFSEWTRSEMQGMALLNSGRVEDAERTFQECLARADQIDVAELRARSYEGLLRVAQKRGDRQAQQTWLQKARQARQP